MNKFYTGVIEYLIESFYMFLIGSREVKRERKRERERERKRERE